MQTPTTESAGEKLVARLEKLGIIGACELVKRHRDQASESLDAGPVTEALIETMLHMATLFSRDHSIDDTQHHLVIHCLALGYHIAVDEMREAVNARLR